jgi:glutamate-1-semialdehyde 2,1-aminomutase
VVQVRSVHRQKISPLPIAATFSKSPCFWGKDFTPSELVGGQAQYVWGSDKYPYLDFVSALGANLLGYNHPSFVGHVTRYVGQAGFSLPHVLERQVADSLVAFLAPQVPGWSNLDLGVRFGLSGSDACSMSIRLARAVTGRRRILSSGYHGFHEAFVSVTPPAHGVTHPQYVEDFAFGDSDWLCTELADGDVAAVIMEQPPIDPDPGWYPAVRQWCDEVGTLLIMDEVVTGLRYGLGGACEVYGIESDLICLGKSLGNGLPVSAIVGNRALFDAFDPNARPNHDPVFVSSTHFGNTVSLAAADAVLDIWDDACVAHLWRIGQSLMDGLRGVGYEVVGHPPRSLLQFNNQSERAYFIREMANRGVLINRPNLPNLAHTDADVAKVVEAAVEVKHEMAGVDVEELMRGKLPLVLFENR